MELSLPLAVKTEEEQKPGSRIRASDAWLNYKGMTPREAQESVRVQATLGVYRAEQRRGRKKHATAYKKRQKKA